MDDKLEKMLKDMKEPLSEKEEEVGDAAGQIADNIFQKGMLPKDALAVSNARAETMYAQAHRLYNGGKYVEASRIFRMLIFLNVTEPKYMLGLAGCFHMLGEYQNGVDGYVRVAMIDPNTPIPYYHMADCHVNLKDNDSAIVSLELAITLCKEKKEYSIIKKRAQMMIEKLEKEEE